MSKADRAKKRAAKKAPGNMPQLAAVPRREKNGCFVERTRQQSDRDPTKTVLSARCNHMGVEDTKENRQAMAVGMMGDPAGRAIAIGAPDNSDSLWQVFSRLDGAVARYYRRILQQDRFAKCGRMEILPERFATSPEDDVPSDLRNDDTKDRDAVNDWVRWQGAVGRLSAFEQSSIWDAVWMRAELVKGGRLTPQGAGFIRAITALDHAERR